MLFSYTVFVVAILYICEILCILCCFLALRSVTLRVVVESNALFFWFALLECCFFFFLISLLTYSNLFLVTYLYFISSIAIERSASTCVLLHIHNPSE